MASMFPFLRLLDLVRLSLNPFLQEIKQSPNLVATEEMQTFANSMP